MQLLCRLAHSLLIANLLLLPLLSQQTLAQQPRVVAGYTEFAPYMFTDATGRATGFSVEILRAAAAANGFDISFQRFTSVGALTDSLASGQVDATVLLGVTPEREQLGTFSRSVGTWSFELLFAYDAPEQVFRGNLDGLKIAVSEGSAPHRLLETRGDIQFVFSSSIAERLFGLFEGSIDAVAGPPNVFRAAAKDVGLAARLSPRTYVLAETPRAFLISNAQPEFLAALNSHIVWLQSSNRMGTFEKEWLASLEPDLVDRLGADVLTYLGICLAVILFLIGLLTITSLKRKVEAADALRTQALLEALDAAQAGIVVFDNSGFVHAHNQAFSSAFPNLRYAMDAKPDAATFFSEMKDNGHFGPDGQGTSTLLTLEGLINGDDAAAAEVILYGRDTLVYACLACRLTDGRLALVATDISELEANNRAIDKQANELRAANKQLATFAHVAAHDLKSPAASTATLLDWIADDLCDAGIEVPDTVDEAIARARSLLRRQVALIEDLLAYARTTRSNSTVQVVQPNERLSTIMALIDIPQGFSIEFEQDLPRVLVDPAAFDLVIRNLLNNAIKHHDQSHGRIVLRSEPDNDEMIAIIVEDDGPGIDAAYVERVFEPFFRLAAHDQIAGSGLGLSVIQNAVHAWGGRVSIGPNTPRGTSIRVTLKVAAAHDARSRLRGEPGVVRGQVA
ncbi:MAG: transporter substrate-binding domain-containing protein [Pseudomonadota bacterium]